MRLPTFARTAAALLAALVISVIAAPAAGAQESLGNKWRVTLVEIAGGHAATYDDGDKKLEMEGIAIYQGRGRGKPFTMRLSQRKPSVIVAPVKITVRTHATLSFAQGGSHNCDYSYDDSTRNLVGVVYVNPNGIRVQWTLAPATFNCSTVPGDPLIPQFDTLPAKAMTQRFPVRRFTKKTAVVPVKIVWEGGTNGWTQTIVWTGKVKFARGK